MRQKVDKVDNEIKEVDLERVEEFIKKLDEKQLRYLNKLIVSRLKFLYKVRVNDEMVKFNVGDSVFFITREGEEVIGEIIRLNTKTLSIIDEYGDRWNVPPSIVKLFLK